MYSKFKIHHIYLLQIFLVFIVVILLSFKPNKEQILKYNSNVYLKNIPEPSDIVYDSQSNHFYIVSDHGKLFECANDGKIIRKAQKEGLDFEGVEVKDSFIYVSDETPRKVYQYRKSDLSLVKIFSVKCGGALNKAYESITYNYTKNCFVMISQQPAIIVEYDEQFNEISRKKFNIGRDISAARWYNGKFYIISSKDACLYVCEATKYDVQQYYKINVINAEGLAFDANGKMLITSDDLQRLYFFNQLPNIKQ